MNLKRYSDCIGKLINLWFEHLDLEEYRDLFAEVFSQTIISDDVTGVPDEVGETLKKAFLSQEYKTISSLSDGLSEIEYCLDTLSDTKIYLRRFPFSGTQITKTNHLRRSIEMYLEEIYLLKERLIGYIGEIKENQDIISALQKEDIFLLDRAKTLSIESLKPITGYGMIRGKHVHERRYTDTDIDRLIRLERLISYSDIEKQFRELFEASRDLEYVKARQKWHKRVEQEITVIEEVVDVYFECLLTALFNKECAPKFPFYE